MYVRPDCPLLTQAPTQRTFAVSADSQEPLSVGVMLLSVSVHRSEYARDNVAKHDEQFGSRAGTSSLIDSASPRFLCRWKTAAM
jgi:hypothetical protein